ncbi:cytoplasmic protein [Fomitiporia mediterranea MF3/22]|uniref:cytoplasmic protein n=1 Tax=Fomitiporia mediterranea (strain MF3/22) TaxID=694068 RepID=UPI0004407ECD|nr:cytoplasmic protein [Fomitiporia mediterranea MF3/22]EJD03246.1 cytoplasmic protein [Fomitiporia mediterranea MF3/22]
MLPSSASQRRGVWEPLSLIVYGYAIHPLSPGQRDTRVSGRTARLSTVTEGSEGDFPHRDIVSLEVGDEIYAFEKYTPKGKECEGVWYRGYVVCTTRRPPINWSAASDPSSSKTLKVAEPQQVFIGIFPASHIHVRDELSDAEGRLADVASQVNGNRDKTREMEPLKEEDEESEQAPNRSQFRLGPPPDQANSSRAGLPVYPPSLRSVSPSESQPFKPLPPRPSLKSGDDTLSGQEQPIIDEIASALREWHNLMFLYLARRDYALFYTVREHIEALHLGRRQLLAQTLSAEETVSLRRDCVGRLVSGNVVQGLDIIVRHPTWGGLVTVDVEGEIDPRSWVSAVRMYAMQVALAYIDVKAPALGAAAEYTSVVPPTGPLPTPASSVFPDVGRPRGNSRVLGSLAPPQPTKPVSAKFYHVFLDLRAFVASPCSPGETAELYFSLYNKNDMRFVTEEFCAVLNHNGVLARDPSARIRTLFTDLVQADIQEPIYLVCKIIRNGALKITNTFNSGIPVESASRGSGEGATAGRWEPSATLNGNNSSTNVTRAGTVSESGYSGQFRRPFGCAVLELSQLREFAKEHAAEGSGPTREHTMPIFVPTNEAVYSMLHQDIIAGNNKEYEKSPRAEMLAVSIKVFHGDAKTIVRENPSLLINIPLTARLGFPDVVFPGDVRNEMYIKLWSGEFFSSSSSARLSVTNFTRGSISTSSNNVQVTVELRDNLGNVVDRGISPGSGEPPVTQFHSMVFVRNNVPTFGELMKLQLPLNGPPNWHLYFTFRNRSSRERPGTRGVNELERPFAFAFLPLLPDSRAFLEDGSHALILYRSSTVNQIPAETYLARLPWTSGGQRMESLAVDAEMMRTCPPIRDNLVIRSSLCSTKFTQNQVLLSLLNWDQLHDREMLSTILSKFTFVGEVEIVKFLRDIFDSLFAILISPSNIAGEMDGLVFNALVTVLGIVQDRRFSNFQPVLDVYIEQHFNCSSASSHMIQSLNRLLSNPTAAENAMPLRAALKVWHYLIKFIVRSRELQKSKELGIAGGATAEHLEATFKRELQTHLAEINRMMSTTTPASIIGTQTIALQHFTSILPELAKVFPTVELVSIVTSFANSVASTKGKVVIWKLITYLQVVKGFLFDIPASRSLLVEAVVIWIKPHFGRFDEYTQTSPGDTENAKDNARVSWLESIRICVTVIAVMLDKLQQNLVNPATASDRNLLRQEQDNVEYLLSLMPRLLDSYREFQSQESIRALERTRSGQALAAPVPVSFPESYPFSLFAHAPSTDREASSAAASSQSIQGAVFNCTLAEIAIVFLVLVLSSPKKDITNFLEASLEIEGKENFASLISGFFKVGCSILDNEAFPSSWLNVNILAHKVLIKMADPVAKLLERDFIPEQEDEYLFNKTLWREALYTLLKLLSSEQLVIEEFSPQKRRAVWRLAGDIRGEGATILLRLWEALGWPEQVSAEAGAVTRYGGYQVAMNTLVGHVVNLCLSHHDRLRNNAVQILYSMIVSEYHISQNFDDIENELVNKLDTLFMSDSKADDISRTFFIGQLRHLFESSFVDEQLRQRVSNFLDSVDLFLELLLNVRALPEGEEFADDRVIATLRLMNFIRRIGRDEIYIKYVHQLVNMHLQSQNYVEAALTLKLHSDLHEWDLNSFVEPMEDLGLPRQSQFHRKETLCLLILDYLGKGKAWENAALICDELAIQHSEVTYNYSRLAEILRHKASLLEHIVTEQRYYPDYFRVAFYGTFPVAIRNKQFIYRGYEWEKFGAFCDRMLNKHPGSQLLRTMGDPPVDIRFGTDQYIQCTAVTPEPDKSLPIFNNPDVPTAVRMYYEHSAINIFSCQRPITKIGANGEEETWILKTYFTTEETFPTVLKRSEVIDIHTVEISPVESALTDVEQKTKDLNILKVKYSALAKTGQPVSTNALSMTLNNAVDAPANGGIALYREAFLSPEYIAQNPDRAELVHRLREAIDDQVRIIDGCLRLHGALCPPEMIPFHETLERFFHKNFSEEIGRLSMDASPIAPSISPSARFPPQDSGSLTQLQERNRSESSHATGATARSKNFYLPPLQVGRSVVTPPPVSPHSVRAQGGMDGAHGGSTGNIAGPSVPHAKQTPLQRNLAHLARHGFNGVAVGPGPGTNMSSDAGGGYNVGAGGLGGDTISVGSPQGSLVNVGTTIGGASTIASGAASAMASNLGSSIGSIKGRFSRLGSLNFGRHGREG